MAQKTASEKASSASVHATKALVLDDRPAVAGVEPSARGWRVVGVGPRGEQHDRDQDHGQQHHHQAEAVEAEGVVHAQRLDPVPHLGELQLLAGVVLGGDADTDRDGEQGEAQTDALDHRAARGLRQAGRDQRADERHEDQRGEPGEVAHEKFTARRASTTSSAPTRMDRA